MRPLILLAVTIPLAAQQIDSNTIQVMVERDIAVPQDIAAVAISILTAGNATLDDVLAQGKNLGLTSDNWTGVSGSFDVFTPQSGTGTTTIGSPGFANAGPDGLTWNFQVLVPLSTISGNLAKFASAITMIRLQNPSWTASISYVGSQTAIANGFDPLACPIDSMAVEARGFGQVLAQASGGSLGPVTGITNVNPNVGYFTLNTGILSYLAPINYMTCQFTVSFALLHN